jgi:hypothetical protein
MARYLAEYPDVAAYATPIWPIFWERQQRRGRALRQVGAVEGHNLSVSRLSCSATTNPDSAPITFTGRVLDLIRTAAIRC